MANVRRLLRGRVALLVAVLLVVTLGWPPEPGLAGSNRHTSSGTAAGTHHVLFGAYVQPASMDTPNRQRAIRRFQHMIGRRLAVTSVYRGWNDAETDEERLDIAAGRIPMTSWELADLESIISGSQDSVIVKKADALKALDGPVFLRPGWEMNGDWEPWNASHYGNDPSVFVAAWQHIHDVFVSRGVTNVRFVWSPNAKDSPQTTWNHWAGYYPGDGYVEWVGIDAYNRGTTRPWSVWTKFATLVRPIYDDYAAAKPIMLAETASVEQGGSKSSWINHAAKAMKGSFPAIGAFVWFNADKTAVANADWRVNTSASALSAYRKMGADPYFQRRRL